MIVLIYISNSLSSLKKYWRKKNLVIKSLMRFLNAKLSKDTNGFNYKCIMSIRKKSFIYAILLFKYLFEIKVVNS